MQQKAIDITINQPPPIDDFSWMWTGVIVPIVLAAVGWWINRKRK